MIRRFLSMIIFGVVLLVAGLIAAPFFIDDQFIKDKLIEVTKTQLDATLTIDGEFSFALFPTLEVKLHDVSLAHNKGQYKLSAKRAMLSTSVLSLLRREVSLNGLELNDAKVEYRAPEGTLPAWFLTERDTKNYDLLKVSADSIELSGYASVIEHKDDQSTTSNRPLLGIDSELELEGENISANNVLANKLRVESSLHREKLTIDIDESDIFGGSIPHVITYDTSGDSPKVTVKGKLEDIHIEQLPPIASALQYLEGTFNVETDLSFAGKTPEQIKSSLNGSGSLVSKDGKVKGINLNGIASNLVDTATKLGSPEKQFTPYADLSASYQIKDGVLTNDDFALISQLVTFNGSGTVNIAANKIDYRLVPNRNESAETSVAQAADLLVPVMITGQLDSPLFLPDLSQISPKDITNKVGNIIKSVEPDKAVETLKDGVGKGLEGFKGLVDGLQ